LALLEIRNLTLGFRSDAGVLLAVENLSLTVSARETVCLVGESGSGKSVTAMSIGRLLPAPPAQYLGGEIFLEGADVLRISKTELRKMRGKSVAFVFQDPGASLNPVHRVGNQIRESLRLHRPAAATDEEVVRLLRLVGIPAPEQRRRDFPHQLSGGMQQRVMIAMALASEPRLLVADEPTTALDVTIQAQILELLLHLKATLGMSILFITHNLGIVAEIADRVAVMYAGQIVETGTARQVLQNPKQPYTRALIDSVPKLGAETARLRGIPGTVPGIGRFPSGCRFHPRCDQRQTDCSMEPPALLEVEPGHWVRCPYFQNHNRTLPRATVDS
jgi:peptide/nickel transport system ATP-binding protein